MNSQHRLIYESLLPVVRKPSQYIGGEINSIKKDLKKIETSIALVFPDMYEIGMSHLGLKILYNIVNKRKEFAAERVFAPDLDYEELLRKKGIPLSSLENKMPLNKFDIVGFSLPYEMSYSNVLNILDMGHIPLLSKDRNGESPLVIGGGPCTYNPEPLAGFFDCFVIGDGEEIILEILRLYSVSKKKKIAKHHLLRQLAEIKGIYVPSMFNIEYFDGGSVKQISPVDDKFSKVEKRILLNLNKAEYPVAPVVPFTRLVHDRITIEIDRGCTEACRFCQAGFVYRPVRERTVDKILELSAASINNTGYDEFSLLSLSSGDYSEIDKLLPKLANRVSSSNISLSLPSLQPRTLKKDLINCIRQTGKSGFTISIEAGSQRLRDILNKNITEEDVLGAVDNIAQSGFEIIKLYFMVGLPTETYEDLEEIYLICKKIYSRAKKNNPRFRKLNISFSFFVPKPHTPFQWLSQDSIVDMESKLKFLKRKFGSQRKYKIKWQNPKLSFLEAVFARGDRRLAKVLLNAFQLGCKFDAWSERFNFDNWTTAFEKAQIDPTFYTQRNFDKNELFPWDFIDIGVKKEYLFKEFLSSKERMKEDDCRTGKCLICGLEKECSEVKKIETRGAQNNEENIPVSDAMCDIELKCAEDLCAPGKTRINIKNGIANQSESFSHSIEQQNNKDVFKYRMQFTKTDQARFLSHLETYSLLIRANRRAKIPIDYSKGFHARPRISFNFALPVGMESKAECFDLLLTKEMKPDVIMERLNNVMPLGMKIISVAEIPLNSKSLSTITNKIQFKIYIDKIGDNELSDLTLEKDRLSNFLSQDKINLLPENGREGEDILFSAWFDDLKIQSETKNSVIVKLTAKVKQGKFISPHRILNILYPELKDNRGSYRMVKEAIDYVN